MKPRTLLSIFALVITISAFGQKPTMVLTFTAENSGQYVPLDSILIENLTQGGDTTLYEPDTVLILDYITSIGDNGVIEKNTFSVSQNYPNPFKEKTEINVYLPVKDDIEITIRDIAGMKLAHYKNTLKRGNHTFSFYSGDGMYYLLTVTGKQTSKSIIMLSINSNIDNKGNCKIVYNGFRDNEISFKTQRLRRVVPALAERAMNNFVFSLGDELKYTAYSYLGERTITDLPAGDQTYIFQFAYGEPCVGMPTVTDNDGNIYNTVEMGSQCWMAENLKTTTYQNGTQIPNVEDNTTWQNLTTGAFAWYYNDINWKDSYGALYNWYATVDINGLCPTGWHVPTDDEWTELVGFIGGAGWPHGNELKSCRQMNSPLGGGCNTSEHPRWNETVAAYGTDDYGFSGLPGGFRNSVGSFYNVGYTGDWWSSIEYSLANAMFRQLSHSTGYLFVGNYLKQHGFSVRCLRD